MSWPWALGPIVKYGLRVVLCVLLEDCAQRSKSFEFVNYKICLNYV